MTRLLLALALLNLTSCGLLDAISPCPPPRIADALEPNDTPATATPLTGLLEGNLNPGETDVFTFETSSASPRQLRALIVEGNGNDRPGLNILIEGPGGFRLERAAFNAGFLEFTPLAAGTHILTITDGSRPYADCLVCTCTGRGPKYTVEVHSVPAP
jgi:hypothetical protein